MLSAGEYVLGILQKIYGDAPVEELVTEAVFPIWVMTPATDLTLATRAELADALRMFRDGVTKIGVKTVQSEIISIVGDGRNFSTVTLENHRIGFDGQSMGMHRATYVVELHDNQWAIRSMSVGDLPDENQVRERLEKMFEGVVLGMGASGKETATGEPA